MGWDHDVCTVLRRTSDKTFRVIMQTPTARFWGKSILFSGDFRRILPIVPRASRGMIDHLGIKSPPWFSEMHRMTFSENLRVRAMDSAPRADAYVIPCLDYRLKVVEGNVLTTEGFCIKLLKCINGVHSSKEYVKKVLDNLDNKSNGIQWLPLRAILARTNSRLCELNSQITESFFGQFLT